MKLIKLKKLKVLKIENLASFNSLYFNFYWNLRGTNDPFCDEEEDPKYPGYSYLPIGDLLKSFADLLSINSLFIGR